MDVENRCRLCLEFTFDDYQLLEDTAKEMIIFVIPKVDIELANGHKICKKCLELLHVACEFKTRCLKCKDDIRDFTEQQGISEKDQNFNHSDLSMSTEEEKLNESKCRICHTEFQTLNQLGTEERDVLWKILLERYFYDMNTTEPPASCEKCLERILHFLNTCSNTDELIKKYCSSKSPSNHTQGNFNDGYISTQFACAGTKNCNIQNETKSEMAVQTESTSDGTIYEPIINLQPIFEIVMQNYEDILLAAEGIDTKNEGESKRRMNAASVYQCNYCSYETKCKRYFKIHSVKHMDPSEIPMYKCDLCSYEAKFKFYVTRHMLIHKDPSEIKMHKCELCPFETKLKGNLTKHMKIHQPLVKTDTTKEFVKCGTCGYETKHEGTMQKHKRCKQCDFETCDFTAFRVHVLKHEDPSAQLFSCSMCSYQGKTEALLKKHTLIHKNPSEIKMYKCEKCYYETRHKHHIDSHILIHKDPWEVEMYKCNICSYETRHKRALKRHKQIHNKQ